MLTCCSVAFITTDSAAQLTPAWTWTSDKAIEWAAPVPAASPSACLVADQTGRVFVIGLIVGKDVLAAPLRAAAGVAYAGANANRVFLFDSNSCHCIELTPLETEVGVSARARWSQSAIVASPQRSDGDPEFDSRIASASAVGSHLVLVRSDGACAALDGATGTVTSRWTIPDMGNVRFVAADARGVLLTLSGSVVRAGLLGGGEAAGASAGPTKFADLGESWPVWTASSERGLLAAWPNRVVALAIEGGAFSTAATLKLHATRPFRATTLAVFDPARAPSDDGARSPRKGPTLLIAADGSGSIRAHDLATQAIEWTAKLDSSPRPEWERVELNGEVVLAFAERGPVVALDVHSGLLLGRIDLVAGETLVSASVQPRGLVAVARRSSTGSGPDREFVLLRTDIRPDGQLKRESGGGSTDRRPLADHGNAKRVEWSPGRLLLTEARKLRVYVLP